MDCRSPDLRRNALSKIAALKTASTEKQAGEPQLSRLYNGLAVSQKRQPPLPNGIDNGTTNTSGTLSQAPMPIAELDVLLALCKSAPLLENAATAKRLQAQLATYMAEAPQQSFANSPFLLSSQPSPWETLSYSLTSAILSIGLKFPVLRETSVECITHYLHSCVRAIKSTSHIEPGPKHDARPRDFTATAAIAVSLIGFLRATSMLTHFFSASGSLDLILQLRQVLTDTFMIAIEGAFSSIRTSEATLKDLRVWKVYTRRYALDGRPLGAMLVQRGLMELLVSVSSLQVTTAEQLQRTDVLEILASKPPSATAQEGESSTALLEVLSDMATEELRLIEDGADYLQLGTAWQQHLAFAVKAHSLSTYLICLIGNEEVADLEILMSWLEDVVSDTVQMADDILARVVLKSFAVLSKYFPSTAPVLSRSLPRYVVQSGIKSDTVGIAAESLATILQQLSSDAVLTGLYSLGNVLSTTSSTDKGVLGASNLPNGSLNLSRYGGQPNHHADGSSISLVLNGEEESAIVHSNVVRAIVTIASRCGDEQITALAQSMLLQKLGRVSLAVDVRIITEVAMLAISSSALDFKSLLKLFSRFSHDANITNNDTLLIAVMDSLKYLSETLEPDSPLFEVYLKHLLETIVSKGDVHESDNSHQADVALAAEEIVQLVRPLALLILGSSNDFKLYQDENIKRLWRQAWFNLVVHGILPESRLGQRCYADLELLAMHSRTLIAEDRADQFESEVELNTVLRRGMTAAHTAEQKKRLIAVLPRCESDIRALSYPKVIFLSAAHLVETLRVGGGDCTHILSYFLDPSLNGSAMENCMGVVADEVLSIYILRTLAKQSQDSAAPLVAKQLASMFAGCCHRITRVQQIATHCADKIIGSIPSSLCQKSSLFALLELLTIMWISCLDGELDEYGWRSNYDSERGNISVELSDDFELRRTTLNSFYKRAKGWLTKVINIAPLDVKGLLQTYLAEYDDDGAYGHIALGRSFAVDMGSLIPSTDQRLGAIDRHGNCTINTASDFVAQYTTRQEYKYSDALPEHDQEWATFLRSNKGEDMANQKSENLSTSQALLALMENRALAKSFIPIGELRDLLRRAAALVCCSKNDQCALLHHLVSVPFAIFNKQSIKLGISLWLGIINENPRMEPRILAEIAECWEGTVRRRIGMFSGKLIHPDPFNVKEEFAPSDKAILSKRQQSVQNLVAPHLRILQFLASHFNASRVGSIHAQRIFHRAVVLTLQQLRRTKGHPLLREIHLHVILFGLNVLRHFTALSQDAKWSLKDDILTAALAWFSHPPRWSFGGNRLQIKAERQLLADVDATLQATSSIGANTIGILQSLSSKQELLLLLLEDEQMRLLVWLYPLDYEKRHVFSSGRSGKAPPDGILVDLLRTAWDENPALAIQLTNRFQSVRLASEFRGLLTKFPEKVIGLPDALQIMLGPSIPTDLSFQLKYLLYWAAVNPITAVTYFTPEYHSNPLIIQYAMRALESHSVDITFFYVPQIVQTLRYDELGYVQRYIIETAKFSQLFAHQIIWNMKANAYKDEDSQIEDSLKPTLDDVTKNMIESFSGTDKAFFEREFSFFDEVTGISGKLRPFIKRSKPEKKQKIEEELRKIKVEVGVYLPSNPEGAVIGIDRKSGKPLQSHAKAPYMATFRIKKTGGSMEGVDEMLEKTNENAESHQTGAVSRESTFEVWQSAIFKVGDDCRQDVLALQMIAAFRGIFNNVGLDVYVYPYRVTATAPGCGVIDVLPNSISRDMLGREAVNGLYEYFVSKYGAENSIRFQEARNNFVKSMAAYSMISYLLQFKDRHNGNIMIDDAGHILHIDFGFCFDIAPGGVKFERAPFKLTSEMVAVMGGSTTSQPYRWFEELCIKAFLASRPYAEKLCHIVMLMLGSGLPCFKPNTIAHLRERFVLEKSEREAADFMRDLISKSYGSYSTKGYDQFQLLTNGIPY